MQFASKNAAYKSFTNKTHIWRDILKRWQRQTDSTSTFCTNAFISVSLRPGFPNCHWRRNQRSVSFDEYLIRRPKPHSYWRSLEIPWLKQVSMGRSCGCRSTPNRQNWRYRGSKCRWRWTLKYYQSMLVEWYLFQQIKITNQSILRESLEIVESLLVLFLSIIKSLLLKPWKPCSIHSNTYKALRLLSNPEISTYIAKRGDRLHKTTYKPFVAEKILALNDAIYHKHFIVHSLPRFSLIPFVCKYQLP